jgi:transcriptional regulator with GAF, ATPase, and Fis domain
VQNHGAEREGMKDKRCYDDIPDVVGNTPMVRLNRIMEGLACSVFAKLEFLNPMGTLFIPLPEGNGRISYWEVIETADRGLIQWALEQSEGRVTTAADLLDLPRSMLRSKIDRYGLASAES